MLAFCQLLVDLELLQRIKLYFLYENHAKGTLHVACYMLTVFSKKTPLTLSISMKGPCDSDFGQQVNQLKGVDIVCLDQIALGLDSIANQEAWIVDPTKLYHLESVFQRYVRQQGSLDD
jgi:hypothetical protein